MEKGFEKACSNNLPKIDFVTINVFFIKCAAYQNAEIQNVKMKRATRENYGDNAVEFVQLRRDSNICTVKGRITPEHRVTKKGYAVTVVLNEQEEEVISCECHDCTASSGGCKHAVAFLMWLHRRSEEPAVTDVTSYWKKSKLSRVGTTLKGCRIREMYSKDSYPPLQVANGGFRNKFLETAKEFGSKSSLVNLFEDDAISRVSLHCMSIKYKKFIEEENIQGNEDEFIKFCEKNITEKDCFDVQAMTMKQSKSPKWYQARFGRITASKLHEASRCQTFDGSLTESIFGSTKISTEDMKRGLNLEDSVLNKVKDELNLNIKKCGFIVNKNFPLFGASPDGITDTYCIEIKCPTKEKTVSHYIVNNKICIKPFTQLQLQMFLTGRKQGIFCVASPKFEADNVVNIIKVELDEEFCKDVMNKASLFWKKAIYKKLVQ